MPEPGKTEEVKPIDFDEIRKGVGLDMATGGLEPGKSVDELEEEARIDTVTGLPNSRALEDHLLGLESERNRYIREGLEVSKGTFLALDLSGLHYTNDTYGREAGDEYLRAVTRSVKRSVRSSDWIFRLGEQSDEISINTPGIVDEKELNKVMDRIDKDLQAENNLIMSKYPGINFSVSQVAVRYGEAISPREANTRAHNEMGKAKDLKKQQTGIRGEKIERIII